MAPGPRLWAKFEARSTVRAIRAKLNTALLFVQRRPARVDGSTRPFFNDFPRYLFFSLSWIPVVIFIQDHVCEIITVKGPSMSPFFNERHNETTRGDVCFAMKWSAQDNLDRGMIVTFYNPLRPDALTTKRIVGLPGDIIHTKPPFGNEYIRVPPHHVWVEGDEGGNLTLDSNTYGPVSIRLIQARLTHILWPFHKAGRVRWWEHPDRLAAFRSQ